MKIFAYSVYLVLIKCSQFDTTNLEIWTEPNKMCELMTRTYNRRKSILSLRPRDQNFKGEVAVLNVVAKMIPTILISDNFF